MKRFRFTLQALLTLRQRQEQGALLHYAEAVQTLAQATRRADAAQEELESAWQRRRERQAGGGPALELAQLGLWCQTVAERRQACEDAATAARAGLDRAWAGLTAARQAREVVDRFFANQKRMHTQAMLREEQKQFDEAASRTAPVLSGRAPAAVACRN